MAATVNIYSYHGTSGSQTGAAIDGSTIKYKDADNDTNDNVNPITIPTSGSVNSYTKYFRFFATTSPATQINNLKVYSDGASGFGTGVDIIANTAAAYATPSKTTLAGSSLFTYTSGAPLSVSGSVTNPTTGAFGDFITSQMVVLSTATQGPTPTETITFSYDES